MSTSKSTKEAVMSKKIEEQEKTNATLQQELAALRAQVNAQVNGTKRQESETRIESTRRRLQSKRGKMSGMTK